MEVLVFFLCWNVKDRMGATGEDGGSGGVHVLITGIVFLPFPGFSQLNTISLSVLAQLGSTHIYSISVLLATDGWKTRTS